VVKKSKKDVIIKFYVTLFIVSLIPVVGLIVQRHQILFILGHLESVAPIEIAILVFELLFDFLVLVVLLVAFVRRKQIIEKLLDAGKTDS